MSTGVVYTWLPFKPVRLQSEMCAPKRQHPPVTQSCMVLWLPSSVSAGFPAVLDRHSVNKYGWTTEEGKGRDHKAATEASDSGGEGKGGEGKVGDEEAPGNSRKTARKRQHKCGVTQTNTHRHTAMYQLPCFVLCPLLYCQTQWR